MPLTARRSMVGLGIAAGLGTLAVLVYLVLTAHQVTTDDAQVEADVVPLAVRAAGLVNKVGVQDNQKVQAGDVIVQLDEAEHILRMQQAQAELNAAQAQKALAQAQQRRVTAPAMKVPMEAAQAAVDLAHAAVQAAQARLELQRLQGAYLQLKAPADGVVSRLSVHRGQLLQAGQTVAALVPVQTYVVANFKETQIGRLRPGQRARIRLDAFPDVRLEGVVESVSAGTGSRFALLPPDNASGNFVKVVQRVPVRLGWRPLPAEALQLRAGLSADVTVDVNKNP